MQADATELSLFVLHRNSQTNKGRWITQPADAIPPYRSTINLHIHINLSIRRLIFLRISCTESSYPQTYKHTLHPSNYHLIASSFNYTLNRKSLHVDLWNAFIHGSFTFFRHWGIVRGSERREPGEDSRNSSYPPPAWIVSLHFGEYVRGLLEDEEDQGLHNNEDEKVLPPCQMVRTLHCCHDFNLQR